MQASRRNLLKSSAIVPAIVAGGLTGQLVTCSGGQVVVNPAVLDAIQQAVAIGCNFIPTVGTIVALVGASFPAVAGVTTIAASVLSEISSVLCASAPVPNPAAAGKYTAKTVVGTNIEVHGWVNQNGKLVYV